MKKYLILILCVLEIACGKGKSSSTGALPPAKANLVAPAQNQACTTGTIISDTQSSIQFSWQSAANATSYEITIKNLLDNTVITQTNSSNSISVTLNRNTPYAWYITSKSSKTSTTAKSDTWKFYNAGLGVLNYAPFPAEIKKPTMYQVITLSAPATSATLSLEWAGSDVDNDISKYDVYWGTSKTEANGFYRTGLNPTQTSTTAVCNINTTYYWKVITTDLAGNSSDSGWYEFSLR